VKHGLGVGLMPDLAVEDDLKNGTLVRLPCTAQTIPYEAFMLMHREKWLAPPLAALEKLVHEIAS
jgi:DNA-binding transcriptional LysR family regulator